MGTRLFVTNLSLETTEEVLRAVLSGHGRIVNKLHMVADRVTGARYGFASAEMGSVSDAEEAVAALDGAEVGGHKLTVLLARLCRYRLGEERDSSGESA